MGSRKSMELFFSVVTMWSWGIFHPTNYVEKVLIEDLRTALTIRLSGFLVGIGAVIYGSLAWIEGSLSPFVFWSYLIKFIIMGFLSIGFRTYYLSSLLRKMGIEVFTRHLIMLVNVSVIPIILCLWIINSVHAYHNILWGSCLCWSLVILVAGLGVMISHRKFSLFMMVLFMLGFESFLAYSFSVLPN